MTRGLMTRGKLSPNMETQLRQEPMSIGRPKQVVDSQPQSGLRQAIVSSSVMQARGAAIQGAFGQALDRRDAIGPAPVRNRTGLPNGLKANLEAMSGFAMDDVRVHHNSARPAQLQALAYTQGAHIHLGPGQERHLPHEAWHVVQQKQGRVKPTLQMKGVAINDDSGLEKEADMRGDAALRSPLRSGAPLVSKDRFPSAVQRITVGIFADGLKLDRKDITPYTPQTVDDEKHRQKANESKAVGDKTKKPKPPKGLVYRHQSPVELRKGAAETVVHAALTKDQWNIVRHGSAVVADVQKRVTQWEKVVEPIADQFYGDKHANLFLAGHGDSNLFDSQVFDIIVQAATNADLRSKIPNVDKQHFLRDAGALAHHVGYSMIKKHYAEATKFLQNPANYQTLKGLVQSSFGQACRQEAVKVLQRAQEGVVAFYESLDDDEKKTSLMNVRIVLFQAGLALQDFMKDEAFYGAILATFKTAHMLTPAGHQRFMAEHKELLSMVGKKQASAGATAAAGIGSAAGAANASAAAVGHVAGPAPKHVVAKPAAKK